MKTAFTLHEVESFLHDIVQVGVDNLRPLASGNISQGWEFEIPEGQKRVLRIANEIKDYVADQYVFKTFGRLLPIPRVFDVGKLGNGAYYCISERAPGVNSRNLEEDQFEKTLPSIDNVLSTLFHTDVSATTGYGHINYATGKGKHSSWQQALLARLDALPTDKLKSNARNIGLDTDLIDAFVEQYASNLEYASEVRRLSHGDLGLDNILVDNDHVTGLIDWAGVGYAEWMYDYAKLEFWWSDTFTDPEAFGKSHDLETENLRQRKALYWARSALSVIQWADEFKSDPVAAWLRLYVGDRLM